MKLRSYQSEAVAAVFAAWEKDRSTLLVLATGLGKTFVASQVLLERRSAGRALWIAHTDELISQAVSCLEKVGLTVEVEKAMQRASHMPMTDVVVATVQTLKSGRLQKWSRNAFKTVVFDEAHHAVSNGYQSIHKHFDEAYVLGLTATPERTDKLALGQVFGSVAYQYDIADGIRDGYLSNIIAMEPQCDALDISNVHSVRGDLSEKELEDAVTKDAVLHQICSVLANETHARPTLAFFPTVHSAYAASRVMAGYIHNPDSVQVIEGRTPKDQRAKILEAYKAGFVQYIFNCAVLTEGFDAPGTSCVAICRPTKSTALYRQMVGRGTRLSPGKSNLLLIDFKGNSGKHELASAFDIFAGIMEEPLERKVMRHIMTEHKDMTLVAAHKLAKEMIAEERARKEALRRGNTHVIADVQYNAKVYSLFGEDREAIAERSSKPMVMERLPHQPRASERQERTLSQWYDIPPDGITPQEAQRLFIIKRKHGPTPKMIELLAKKSIPAKDMTYAEARSVIAVLAKNGWRVTDEVRKAAKMP